MNIYLTFDYELFVNDKTGDIDNCLIIPTKHFLEMFDRHGVKATFFIDMAYCFRLNELKGKYSNLKIDYEKFCEQVKEIKARGHEIALHLHPQWFYAEYDGEKWIMDFNHYKLSDMPLEEANAKFDVCCTMLRNISGYDVNSFRAGGFSIQDYEGFYDAMARNGLIKDSSVLFGEKQITSLHSYDYSGVKISDAYSFSDDVAKSSIDGEYTEFPISTIKMPFLKYCAYKIKWKLSKNHSFVSWGNGGDYAERRRKEFNENVKRRLKEGVRTWASADGRLTEFLPLFIKERTKQHNQSLVILGHPKLASLGSIRNLEQFIKDNNGKHSFATI